MNASVFRAARAGWPSLPLLVLVLAPHLGACDEGSSAAPPSGASPQPAASAAPTPSPPPAPEPPRPPDIIVDRSTVSVGRERVPIGDSGLASAVASVLAAQPVVAGQALDVVVMRNAKPSQVESVIAALQTAKAASAAIKTETRDGKTVRVPITFSKSLADCVTVGFIAKDAAIEVWPAGGGKPKRVIRGLAGPDMTLGTDAMREQAAGCSAQEIAVGADDSMTWGLVFDLATNALSAPGSRASMVALVPAATPGKRLAP
jgi:hypothetical protein